MTTYVAPRIRLYFYCARNEYIPFDITNASKCSKQFEVFVTPSEILLKSCACPKMLTQINSNQTNGGDNLNDVGKQVLLIS